MKKLITLFFAAAVLVSVPFVSGTVSSTDTSFSAVGQTVTVKRRKKGIARRTYAGGKWVVRKTWNGTKWVSRRVWVATKWTGKKTWKTSRKVVSRTKKIVY